MVADEVFENSYNLENCTINIERDEKGEFTNSEGSDEYYLTEMTTLTSPGGKAKLYVLIFRNICLE